jgi:NAD(P)-dependent dehydrogenase (short-subunit alcohol dehydrogenase family)
MELKDRVVVVTGGGHGIGAELAHRFTAEGASVVVADLDGTAAEAVAEHIGGAAVQLDVSDEEAVANLVGLVTQDRGRIDLFCSNAGIATGGGVEVTDALWQRTWDVNVMAHVYAARAVLPQMLERGEGYLLHTASAAGLLTSLGAAPYSVTKHAVVALAEWLAITYGDRGIRVSCLCPQFVATGMLDVYADQPRMDEYVRSGAISVTEVGAAVVAGLADERFLILPHPEVGEYFRRKGDDYDRWLGGMRRLQRSLGEDTAG